MVKADGKKADPEICKVLVEAIRKIKQQKQRPGVERIINATLLIQSLPTKTIEDQLELAVKEGLIIKSCNKVGVVTYKDPDTAKQLKTRTLKVERNADLTKIVVRTLKELADDNGSSLRNIERYIRNSYNVDESQGDLGFHIRTSVKVAVNCKKLIQEGRLYKLLSNHNDSTRTVSTESKAAPDWTYEVIVDKCDKPKARFNFVFCCACLLYIYEG